MRHFWTAMRMQSHSSHYILSQMKQKSERTDLKRWSFQELLLKHRKSVKFYRYLHLSKHKHVMNSRSTSMIKTYIIERNMPKSQQCTRTMCNFKYSFYFSVFLIFYNKQALLWSLGTEWLGYFVVCISKDMEY